MSDRRASLFGASARGGGPRDTLRSPTWWLALASYVVLAVLFVGPTTLVSPTEVAGQGVDLPGTLWIHWWVRTTLESFTLPITTDLLFYPDGKNFFADTGANYVDAYLGVPLQWLFGVPGFLDPLNVVILVGNALAFCALARDYTGGRWGPAWAATVLFSLNPFVLRQLGEGRPTQALLWFVILAVRYALRLRTGTPRDAALFGVHTALAAITYWFTAYFLAFALLPVVFVELVRAPRVVLPRLALAVAVTLGITAPFLLGIAAELEAGSVRRLQYANWADGPAGSTSRWSIVAGDLSSATWLAAIGLAAYAGRRAWPLLLGVVFSLLFAVGARLDLADPPLLNHAYIFLWDHLPLLTRLGFPDRAACVGFVLLALAAAYGLTRVDAVWPPLVALVAIGEVLWRGDLPLPRTEYIQVPCAERVRQEGGAVFGLPLASSEAGMVVQTMHGQPVFGGMGEREPDLRPKGYDERLHNTFVIAMGGTLSDEYPPIGYRREDRDAIAAQFRWVWFDLTFTPPNWIGAGYTPPGVLRRLNQELGAPVVQDPLCVLYDLHAPIPADAPGLAPTAKLASTELEHLGVTNLPSADAGKE